MEQDGQSVGFFPYQRRGKHTAVPVSGPLSAYQAIVVREDVTWDAAELVRACGLSAWHFGSMIVSQEPFVPYHQVLVDCPYMDLSQGFEVYQAEQKKARSQLLGQTLRKTRKMGREVGELRFEWNDPDPAVFNQLIEWKSAQFQLTKIPNLLAIDWTVELLKRVIQHQSEGFEGLLSSLYVDDRLVAMSLGIRSYGEHYMWVPSYDKDLSKYSPGLVLLVEQAKAAQDHGVNRIVLGTGPEQYKKSFTSGTFPLAEGAVDFRPIRGAMVRGLRSTRDRLRASPLQGIIRGPWRMTRHIREKLSLHDGLTD